MNVHRLATTLASPTARANRKKYVIYIDIVTVCYSSFLIGVPIVYQDRIHAGRVVWRAKLMQG